MPLSHVQAPLPVIVQLKSAVSNNPSHKTDQEEQDDSADGS